jgi:hypothetical protein
MSAKETQDRRHARPATKPDASHPAENDTGGNPRPSQPSTDEQSGSTGRRVADDRQPAGKDTGQDRYGQNGADANPSPDNAASKGKTPHRR